MTEDLFSRQARLEMEADERKPEPHDVDPDIRRQFEEWKQTPGANHVLKDLHAKAYPYAKRYIKTGQRVSVRLLWELERDRIKYVRARLKRRGIDLGKWKGYRLNNNLHSMVARHITERHPEWQGMFEMRERKAA